MKKGDIIRVHWVDIAAFPTADPEHAHPVAMQTIGHFAGWFPDKVRGRYMCVSDTICEASNGDGDSYYGATAFPQGCIRAIEELRVCKKRPKKQKKKALNKKKLLNK